MFGKDTYVARRRQLKQKLGKGLLLFLGNDECGMNFEDNTGQQILSVAAVLFHVNQKS